MMDATRIRAIAVKVGSPMPSGGRAVAIRWHHADADDPGSHALSVPGGGLDHGHALLHHWTEGYIIDPAMVAEVLPFEAVETAQRLRSDQ